LFRIDAVTAHAPAADTAALMPANKRRWVTNGGFTYDGAFSVRFPRKYGLS